MNNKMVASWVSFAVVLSFIIIIIDIAPVVEAPTTIYVGSGPGNHTNSIQDAIYNYANPGDTVFVYNGTYVENVNVNKTINLTGEDRDGTTIDSGGSGNVVYVDVNWVNITGFTITNGSYGIWLDSSSNNSIINNNIKSNKGLPAGFGIVCGSTSNISIRNNNVLDNGNGISLSLSSNYIIEGNDVSWNDDTGIWFDVLSNSTITNNKISLNVGYGLAFAMGSNNTITGNDVFSNGQHGIYLSLSSNNTITGNNVSSSGQYGIYLSSSSNNMITGNNLSPDNSVGVYLSSSSNNTIKDNDIISNNQFGIRLSSSSNNKITNNNILNNKNGIDLGGSHDNTIDGNEITGIVAPGDQYGIYLSNSLRNKISNNNIHFAFDYLILLHPNSHWNEVEKNTVCDGPYAGIYLQSSNYNNVSENTIYNLSGYYGVTLERSSWNNISDNSIFNLTTVGIVVQGAFGTQANYNNITNNTIYNISLGSGIVLNGASTATNYNIVTNNTIYNIPLYSIQLYKNVNYNIIKGNLIYNSTPGGFLVLSSSHNNITNNTVIRTEMGINITSSSNNTFIGNIIWKNDQGIYLFDSSGNKFYHNHIVDNSIQVFLNISNCFNNIWNNTEGEGNFWSDYDGIDGGGMVYPWDFIGKHLIAGDGVGDTEVPHPFTDQGNGYFQLDFYPLISPMGNFLLLYEGWNLISIPFIQLNKDLGTVLKSIIGSYSAVQWYNTSDNFDYWKHNSTKKPHHLNDLDNIDHTMGFWIHIIEPDGVIFKYTGTQPISNQSITLYPGWNLVGYPSPTSYNRTKGLNNLTFYNEVDSIWTYDAATQKWKNLSPSDYFELGRGYWVHANTKCVWEVPL